MYPDFAGSIMAKALLKLEARKLRRRGVSVKKIAAHLGIARSSASIWVRDIVLSIEQLEILRKSSLEGGERGRLKSALLQKERWKKNMEVFKELGINTIGALTERELLIAGLALYWGEGYKKGRRLQFCNSDPKMIKFLLYWLQKCFGIERQDIRCRLGINEIHRKRDEVVKVYWSKVTEVALDQFTKTSFKKVNNKKVYENFHEHYGTLAIEIRQPARFYGKIIGLIEGLSEARLASTLALAG
jgi:hypothetical protein